MKDIKADFPIFTNLPSLVYLDSAATTQKPQVVIDAVKDFYENKNSNIHRGVYDLSQGATELFEETRKKVAGFIGAASSSEIIFTQNTTEAINLVARGWAKTNLQKGDIVVLTEMEHNSNVVPWLRLKEEIGIEIFFLSINKEYRLEYSDDLLANRDKIKLISLTHASNVLGTVNPLGEIIAHLKKLNPNLVVVVDAAQSVAHIAIDVQKIDCDFLAFSSHKMLGPSGVGVLYGKKSLLNAMEPFVVGSHTVTKVTKQKVTWADLPDKFEAGTRNLEGVVGLGAAIDYLQKIGMSYVESYEKELTEYALQRLLKVCQLELVGPKDTDDRLGILSFTFGKVHSHDVAEILNRFNIAVRSGHHCAHILGEVTGAQSTCRASFYIYNTKADVDKLVEGLEKVNKVFKV